MKVKPSAVPESDPADFLQRLQQQEKDAFTRLVQTLHLPLKRFIRAIAGATLAEDILQETWLAAYRGLPGFEGRAGVKTWLFTIARHEANKQLRKKYQLHASPDAEADESDAADAWLEQQFDQDGHWQDNPRTWDSDTPEALLQAQELKACIDRTLHGMKAEQVTVLNLRELEQMSMQQISTVTGLSNTHVRVLLHRARLQLLRTITHYQQSGECSINFSTSIRGA